MISKDIIHPKKLHKGDYVGIVSLSDGVLGEPFVKHEINLLEDRLLDDFGLKFKYMDNSRKGVEFLRSHPEARAADLEQAFLDPDIKIIWTALGGDDTFRTLPYLMNDKFKKIVQNNPKIFLGMSDTTNNHIMLYGMGLATFYGPALLSDISELGPQIFPFTKKWLDELFLNNKNIIIKSSPEWYKSRTSFGPDQLGVAREDCIEHRGHEYFNGGGIVEGCLLGGCIDSLYEMLNGERYADQRSIFSKYHIFPNANVWRDKVVFLETSEECPEPNRYKLMLNDLAAKSVFANAKALMVGKPQNEVYYDEYREIVRDLSHEYSLPTVFNLNFGHATPRIILPYGAKLRINFDNKVISLPDGLGTE